MKKILVSGSIAYDYIYTFDGVFQNELLLDRKGALSVAFTVTNKTVHYGGCSGNIVFNGKLLENDFVMVGIAGKDFEQYKNWLGQNKIDTSNVIVEKSKYTAQATVVTDKKGQQITFFYEGAASLSVKHKVKIKNVIKKNASDCKLAIVSPNNPAFIMASVEAFLENEIPFFFDPGQVIPAFKSADLINCLKKSAGFFLNEYELELFKKQTGLTLNGIVKICPLVILTMGGKGAKIYFKGKKIDIPTKKVKNAVDPTGCGDAFRAGFLIGIRPYFPNLSVQIVESAAKLGTKIALSCLGVMGTQNHKIS